MRDFIPRLGLMFVDTVRQDVRYSIRMMRRAPMFSVTAVATVALSTAAIATVGSLADTLLWRQLPVDDAERLVSITATRGRLRSDGAISYPDYVVFRDLLYGSPEADWLFYAAAAAVIACVGLGASLVPARRAAAVEPIIALRHE